MHRNAGRNLWAFLVSLLVLVGLPLGAADDKTDPRVYEVGAKVEGKTYAEWSAAWWRWALPIKKDRNPILDKDGSLAAEGQSGPVWFLAGNVGGKMTRKCTIPAGKPIFFSPLNAIETATPDKADDKALLAGAKAFMDGTIKVSATLDGKPIVGLERSRVASAVFEFTGPDKKDALADDVAGKNKAASDGFWVMLKPLPTGKHTLHFKGKVKQAGSADPFDLDVTFELTVAEKK